LSGTRTGKPESDSWIVTQLTVASAHRGVNYQCEFCDRKFNRTDNRRSHLRLHANPLKKGRVKYVPEAAKLLEEEERLYKSGKRIRKTGTSFS
jgi:hypothetical protein